MPDAHYAKRKPIILPRKTNALPLFGLPQATALPTSPVTSSGHAKSVSATNTPLTKPAGLLHAIEPPCRHSNKSEWNYWGASRRQHLSITGSLSLPATSPATPKRKPCQEVVWPK